MTRLICMTGILALLAPGMARGDDNAERQAVPIGCRLSGEAFTDRMAEIEILFANMIEKKELEDGYAFGFPGNPDQAGRLLAFINGERDCCRFFTFELAFEPDQGPIWLRLRGSQEVKSFLEALMMR